MTNDQAERIERKLDELLEMLRDFSKPLAVFNELVVQADYVTKAKQLNKNTISKNDKLEKYNAFGKRKVLMSLESVAVVKNRKKPVRKRK
jgi:hypothetical protein